MRPTTTTGAARVSDSHCQASNCSAGIIARRTTGTVERDRDRAAACAATAVSSRSALARTASIAGAQVGWLGKPRGVPGGFDLGDEVVGADAVGNGDLGLLGRVVDRRGDAVDLVEPLLDAGGARRAGHPADDQVDAVPAGVWDDAWWCPSAASVRRRAACRGAGVDVGRVDDEAGGVDHAVDLEVEEQGVGARRGDLDREADRARPARRRAGGRGGRRGRRRGGRRGGRPRRGRARS